MVNRTLSIWNELRPFSVGFDDIFAHFNHTLEHTANQTQSYPHYNINKIDDLNWSIEVALAGFDKKDIEVSYSDNCLTIKSIFDKDENEEKSKSVHRGISKRHFTRRFTLADEVVVNSAELKNGMLVVDLEKIVPEAKKPRTIKIK
jgi:molecular chaperone IbpA